MAGLYDIGMGNSWFKAKFLSFSRIDKEPPRSIAWLSAKLAGFRVARTSRNLGLLLRFIYVNSFQFEGKKNDPLASPPMEVLFVATRKDFRSLELAINGVIETCRGEISRISVIVPEQDLALCEETVASCVASEIEINIRRESSVLEESLAELIFSRFGTRGGWVLQQVLKIEYARNSPSASVLIIDADTILIIQVLMPSWEYHRPYFEFLSALEPFKSQKPFSPRFSFVSHHMLMQPKIVKEIYQACGWNSPKILVNYLCQLSNIESQSPISLDYELYGHFLLLRYPEKVALVKWGNTSARFAQNISIELLKHRYSHFASISLHTYLD
jgi:hypothetical protein